MPKQPDEFYQPTFSKEEVETLIWACVLDNIPANMVVRLLVASIYGARRSELTELTSEDIHLNGTTSTIFIRTKKGGQKKPQPIPRAIVPLFDVPISPIPGHTLQRELQKICRKAKVRLPYRSGYHSFRRSVVTTVSEVEPSDINVSNFMRWAKPRSMLARYKQTPVEVTDKTILEKHPYVKIWAEAATLLVKFNSSYNSSYEPLSHNTQ
jgi:integrase